MSNTIELWTAQSQLVLDTLEQRGVYVVKRAYVRQKYGESAWSFTTAYDFFAREAEKRLPKPEGAEYPVWLFRDKARALSAAGGWLLQLALPREQVLLFDLRDWDRILNLSPLGSPAERAQLEEELRRLGVAHPSEVFRRPFYPLQKQKILKSWERLFQGPLPQDAYLQGASWQLKPQWIISKRPL